MISLGQCRAARGLLDWSQQRLAEQSGGAPTTIRQLESGTHEVRRATLYVVCQAFHKAGVEFIDGNGGGPGVRLQESINVPAKERARVTAEPDGVPNATKQLQFSLERDDSGAAESGSSVLVIHPIFLGVILNCNLNLILRNDDDALRHIVVFDGVMDAGSY